MSPEEVAGLKPGDLVYREKTDTIIVLVPDPHAPGMTHGWRGIILWGEMDGAYVGDSYSPVLHLKVYRKAQPGDLGRLQ
jgi:hypothetical protein